MVLFFATGVFCGLGMDEWRADNHDGANTGVVDEMLSLGMGGVAEFFLEEGYFHTTDMLNNTTDVRTVSGLPLGIYIKKVRS